MYIQLKHALSDLALRALDEAYSAHSGGSRRFISRAALLAAYARRAPKGGPAPREVVERLAAALMEGARVPDDLTWDLAQDFLAYDRERDTLSLRPEYSPHSAYFRQQVVRLWEVLQACWRDARGGDLRPVRLGLLLFNHGLFFACHEFLEGVWRSAPEEDRGFYHGLIQVAAAFYHYERGNLRGAQVLLQRALAKLGGYGPSYLGVDLEDLRQQLSHWLGAFSRGRYPARASLPRVKFHDLERLTSW